MSKNRTSSCLAELTVEWVETHLHHIMKHACEGATVVHAVQESMQAAGRADLVEGVCFLKVMRK